MGKRKKITSWNLALLCFGRGESCRDVRLPPSRLSVLFVSSKDSVVYAYGLGLCLGDDFGVGDFEDKTMLAAVTPALAADEDILESSASKGLTYKFESFTPISSVRSACELNGCVLQEAKVSVESIEAKSTPALV